MTATWQVPAIVRLTVVSSNGYTSSAGERNEKPLERSWVECPDATQMESPDVVKSEPALSQYLHDPDVQLMLCKARGRRGFFATRRELSGSAGRRPIPFAGQSRSG